MVEYPKCPVVIMRNPYVNGNPVDRDKFLCSQMSNLARGYAYVKGLQAAVRNPKVAHNSVNAGSSVLTLFALP